MMVLFPVVACLGVLACTVRSLGLGFAALIGVRYFNGLIRANFLGIHTTFMFDFGLLGLYAGFFYGWPREARGIASSTLGHWVVALIAWPTLLSLMPINDLLVQFVALRATVWFLPVILLATRLLRLDLDTIALGMAVLNLMALAVGLYIYEYGIEALYPENAVTQIIYRSRDVGEGGEFHRIPSSFMNSHSYGGTMLVSLPFLIGCLFSPGVRGNRRILLVAGLIAALGGILLCGARSPVLILVATSVVLFVASRFNLLVAASALGLLFAALVVSSTNVRLQRAASLENTTSVTGRVAVSMNESFLDLMADYPLGAGMGSAVGTSIPFFLADRAPQQFGLENEYSRILIDQGLIGLGLWVGFIIWMYMRLPLARIRFAWGLGVLLMYSLTLSYWASAFIGSGITTSIPVAVMMLTQMGILYRVRAGTRNAGS